MADRTNNIRFALDNAVLHSGYVTGAEPRCASVARRQLRRVVCVGQWHLDSALTKHHPTQGDCVNVECKGAEWAQEFTVFRVSYKKIVLRIRTEITISLAKLTDYFYWYYLVFDSEATSSVCRFRRACAAKHKLKQHRKDRGGIELNNGGDVKLPRVPRARRADGREHRRPR